MKAATGWRFCFHPGDCPTASPPSPCSGYMQAVASILSLCSFYLEHSTPLPTHQPHPLSWLNLFTPHMSSEMPLLEKALLTP